jgi:hypothetical protein
VPGHTNSTASTAAYGVRACTHSDGELGRPTYKPAAGISTEQTVFSVWSASELHKKEQVGPGQLQYALLEGISAYGYWIFGVEA